MYQRLLSVRKEARTESGFTLIELLIVIVILGVLAAVVTFSVRGIADRGDVAACRANASTAQTAVEAYYAKESSYPASLATLVTEGFLKSDPSANTVDSKIRVGYAAATGTVSKGSATGC